MYSAIIPQDAFPASAQAAYRANLAAFVSVSEAAIFLAVEQASVRVTATIVTYSLEEATAVAAKLLTISNDPPAASLALGVIIESMTTPTITIPLAPLPVTPPSLPPQPLPPALPAPPDANATQTGNAEAAEGSSGERFAIFGGAAGIVLVLLCGCALRYRLQSTKLPVAGRQVYPRVPKAQGGSAAVPAKTGPDGDAASPPRVHARPMMQAAPHVHARPQVQGAVQEREFVQTKVPRAKKQGNDAKAGELRTGAVVPRSRRSFNAIDDMVVDEVNDEPVASAPSEVTPAWQKRADAAAAAAALAAARNSSFPPSKPVTPQEMADDLLMEAIRDKAPANAPSSQTLQPEQSIDALYADGSEPGSAPPSAPGPASRLNSPGSKGAYVVRKTEKSELKLNKNN